MKKIQRVLSVLLVCCMAVTLLPTTVWAADSDFTIDENGVLTKYNGTGGDVTIPNSVTTIGDSAFYNCSALISILIPESITSIGRDAFSGCSGLANVTIPNSVTTIGARAFENCTSLTNVTIPNSVTSMESSVFDGCSGLSSAGPIGSGYNYEFGWTDEIPAYAFYNCSNLANVSIPSSVTIIGKSAFVGCSGLTSVTIPDGVTSIGDSALADCSGLIHVTIPNSVTTIGTRAFSDCNSLTSMAIPNSVTTIGAHAFENCTSLTNVTIPNSVTSMGESVFNGCSGLSSAGPIGGGYNYEFGWINEIPTYAFSGCSALTSVAIPDSITSIGDDAFVDCSGLTYVTIPNSVTTIGEYAFSDCDSLTSMAIPNSVTTIGDGVFWSCNNLVSVTISNSVTTIKYDMFAWCSNLTSVSIPVGITTIEQDAFFDCKGLTHVTIPISVTTIDGYAFAQCSNLTDVYYAGSKESWALISVDKPFGTTVTIHYNSTGPDDVSSDNMNPVYFLSNWNAVTRTVQFGDNTLSTPITYTVADSVEISNINSLLNKYVLVTMEQGDSSLEYTITDIQPVESKIGTVSATGEHSLTIDGTTYPVRVDYLLASHDGKEVLYHVYNGSIMDFDVLEEKTGTLEAWDSATGRATIGGIVYPTNFLSAVSNLSLVLCQVSK